MAYEVLGSQHVGKRQPLVLIGGMSSRRGDWERLAVSLADVRPGMRLAFRLLQDLSEHLEVLLFDYRCASRVSSAVRVIYRTMHRGMGDSRLAPDVEDLTIESLARDLLFLLEHLQWKELSLCGFSMGGGYIRLREADVTFNSRDLGIVAQQLLFLPYHTAEPTPLPFRVTHVILAGTLCSVLTDRRYGLRVNKNEFTVPFTLEQRREIARPTLLSTFDPTWIVKNSERFEWWLNRMVSGGR